MQLEQRAEYQLLINGEWRPAASRKTFPTLNPATNERLAEVAEAGAEDVDLAVKAAREAFDRGPWPRMRPAERRRLLLRLAGLIEQCAPQLARLDALDVGKVMRDTLNDELPTVVDLFQYYAGWVDNIMGETIPVAEHLFNYTVREPRGVVGIITPWNYPLAESAIQWAPALACGNCIVAKPAEQDPIGPLMLGQLAQEAGLPPGVVNVICGTGPTTGAALASHPLVDCVAFTGSTATGKVIMKTAADTMKHISMQLGGKAPMLVLADADPAAAVWAALKGAYLHQGQVCECTTRLLIEEKVCDSFLEKLLGAIAQVNVGDPLAADTGMGAVITRSHLERIEGYVSSGRQERAQLLFGGARPEGKQFERGNWFTPTVFAGVRREMKIARDEIFGPVLCVMPFRHEQAAVEMANDTQYGLAAAVWTNDVSRAHRLARAIKAGTVCINNDTQVWTYNAPFGGYKQSGFGREFGRYSIDAFTQVKHVWLNLDKTPQLWGRGAGA